MTDPYISKLIKKRILMCLISSGIISDIRQWTNETSTIMHSWIKKQKFNKVKGCWEGGFEVAAIMGNDTLWCNYNSKIDRYSFYIKDKNISPDKLYCMIDDLIKMLGINKFEFYAKCVSGFWTVDHKSSSIVYNPKSIGISIKQSKLPDVEDFSKHSINVDYNNILLEDDRGRSIMRVKTGLLEITKLPTYKISDFQFRGVSFRDLITCGIMTNNFSFSNANRDKLLSLIKKLECRKPTYITHMTKTKLSLSDEWKISENIEDDETDVEMEYKMKSEEKEDLDSWIFGAIQSFHKEDIRSEILESNWDDFISSAKQFIEGFDMTFSQNIEFSLNHSRRILHNVYNFNEYVVCSQLLDDMRINAQTIKSIMSLIKNKREVIANALITYYNDLLHNTSIHTPDGILMNMNDNFLNKFDITTRADDFNF